MNNHVTSLEISQRLKALGVEQESMWYWSFYALNGSTDLPSWHLVMTSMPDKNYVSAFLASEIWDKLPEKVWREKAGCGGKGYFYKQMYGKRIGYWDSSGRSLGGESFECDSWIDALALMLEYLIQNKMITI